MLILWSNSCKRAGGSGKLFGGRNTLYFANYLLAFSLNYIVKEDDLVVDDVNATLNIYEDKKSDSGNVVKVGTYTITNFQIWTCQANTCILW